MFIVTQGTMIVSNYAYYTPPIYLGFIQSQQLIGWRWSMEGMVSKELLDLDMVDVLEPHSRLTCDARMAGLITKLLEATHGS
jgi:hypothetical protein